jgi:predicted ATPase
MRVSVTGSHATGKTTVIRAFAASRGADEPHVELIHEVARDLITAGYQMNDEVTPESFSRYIFLQLQRERMAAESRHVLSDRSLLDLLAYVTASPNTSLSSLHVELLEELVWLESKYFDHYAYVPVEFERVVDEVRPADRMYQTRIDARIRELLVEFNLPTSIVSGNIETRTQQLATLFIR